jgi:hypothetical protein
MGGGALYKPAQADTGHRIGHTAKTTGGRHPIRLEPRTHNLGPGRMLHSNALRLARIFLVLAKHVSEPKSTALGR